MARGDLMKEEELYPLLKEYFEKQGFIVQAEVNNIDIVAKKDDLLIIVEMKTQLNLKLIYQGCIRQRINDFVYLAIPKSNNKKTLNERIQILRRLNLGLLVVDLVNESVEAVIDPTDFVFRRSKKKKQRLLKEINARVIRGLRQTNWRGPRTYFASLLSESLRLRLWLFGGS